MFYNTLIDLCNERGKKITPLLLELKLGTGSISRWRKGVIPNGETLMILSGYFGVSVDFLLFGKNPDYDFSPEEKELLKYFNLLSEPNKIKVIERAKTLYEEHNA